MHRPGEPQHDIVAFGQKTDGPLGLEARGILKFLAERPARWAPYGQNNFSVRYRTLVEHFSVFLQKWRAKVEVSFLRNCVDPNTPTPPRSRWMAAWMLMRRQRPTAATMRPPRGPRTWRATMAASPALPPAGPLPTPLRPAWESRGGGNTVSCDCNRTC
jgi:hypothetical protein